jgi:hypothetical protein
MEPESPLDASYRFGSAKVGRDRLRGVGPHVRTGKNVLGDYPSPPTFTQGQSAVPAQRDQRGNPCLSAFDANPTILHVHRRPLQAEKIGLREASLQRKNENRLRRPKALVLNRCRLTVWDSSTTEAPGHLVERRRNLLMGLSHLGEHAAKPFDIVESSDECRLLFTRKLQP